MIDIVSVKQMQDFDRNTIETTTPSVVLLKRAAESVYSEIDTKGKQVYIICGSGNNGGDGLALCEIMIEHNETPKVFLVSNKISNDSNYYLERLKQLNYSNIFDISECDYKADIIVDCILGTGFFGEVKQTLVPIIDSVNNSSAYVVAVDIPSGLSGNSGVTTKAIKANKTVAIQYLKYGHFLNDGKDYIGEIVYKDIGITKTEETAKIVEEDDISFAKRKNNSSKLTYGRSLIIGGCENFVGAVKIANMGVSALRTGCGLNTLAVPKSLVPAIQVSAIESTIYPLSEVDGHILFDEKEIDKIMSSITACAIGMGMGNNYEENYKLIKHIVDNYSIPVVLDADGINTFKNRESELVNVKAKLILTPHIKELSRLIKVSEQEIINDPVKYAKYSANLLGAVVMLKGSTSVVTNGNDVYFIVNGGPELSKGGSGDTLSGVILGLLAQGVEPIKAVYTGAFLCAKAANNMKDIYSEYGVLASDVAKEIKNLIK